MNRMKLFLVIFAIGMLYNCSNDFELIAEGKDIPVVYGLLSRADTAHYIRIEKAFVDPKTSALQIAQRPDSLYYEALSVVIENTDNSQSWQLERVDGNKEGYVREEGVFASAPNYLYKFKTDVGDELIGGATYRIIIQRDDNLPAVTAEAVMLSDLTFSKPINNDRPINWEYGPGVTSRPDVTWRFVDGEAVFFDLKIRIRINQINLSNPTESKQLTLLWPVSKTILPEAGRLSTNFKIEAIGLFQFIGNELDGDPNVEHQFSGYDYIVDAGGQDLLNYINIGQANTGITSAQLITNYTNLSEGLGVFSSRNTAVFPDFRLNSIATDSLRNGRFTKDLNFR